MKGETGRLGRRGAELTAAVYRRVGPWSRRAAALVTALVVVSLARVDVARGQPAGETEAGLRLDLVRGPLISSSRITGMGGAFAGVAVGIDGVWRNPATLANRPDDSTSWLDYDLTFDWLIVDASEVDFDGDGLEPDGSREFRAVDLGLSLQFDTVAIGVIAALYGYGVEGGDAEAAGASDVAYTDVLAGIAWAIDGGSWIVGAGVQASVLAITTPEIAQGGEVALAGAAADVGVLHRPRAAPWRLGARVRLGAELEPSDEADGQPATSGITAAVPWQAGLGWSLFLAADPARTYNPRLRAPPPALLDRRYLLLSTEIVVTGATGGQSLEAVVAGGRSRSSDDRPTVALHAGAEGEVFHDRVRARLGTYFEPNRFGRGLAGRLHVTGGVEIHLLEIIFDWKVTFGFDLAPGWENVSFGVGFWK
ncbi:MAG: hypothetical protein IT385_08895 [Deltaproteobacteria bacterium]|nr:hypothetical protein [Deltaproteobacteria bacterium]